MKTKLTQSLKGFFFLGLLISLPLAVVGYLTKESAKCDMCGQKATVITYDDQDHLRFLCKPHAVFVLQTEANR